MREDEEPKAPRHASAAATRNGNLPSRDGKLLYVTAICLIPDRYLSSYSINLFNSNISTRYYLYIYLAFLYFRLSYN